MDNIWKSGILAGVIGAVITLAGLVVLGSWFKVFTEQIALFLLLLLFTNLLAFAVAGLISGILVSPYARNVNESLKSGLIAGCIVAISPILLIVILSMAGVLKMEVSPFEWPVILGSLAFICILISQVALVGLISFVYTGFRDRSKQNQKAASSDEGGLDDLKVLYDDLWKDARTLVVDMNRSILLYLFAGCLMLVFGFVILAYAAVSLQHIFSGSGDPADYFAAIGETVGGVIQIIVGPLLISWYFKLKSRYAKLTAIEKGDVR